MKRDPKKAAEATCLECGGALETRSYVHDEQVGRWKVSDGTGMRLKCTKCGEVHLSLDDLEMYQRRAAKTALLENKYEGPVLRYARKSLGLTQRELASLLGYQPETVSKWETNTETFDRTVALAVISILVMALDGIHPRRLMDLQNVAAQAASGDNVHTLRVPDPPQKQAC